MPVGSAGGVATFAYLAACHDERSAAFYDVWVDGAWGGPGLLGLALVG